MTSFIKPSVLKLAGYASPPQKEFRVKLNQNESPFDVPQFLKDEVAETIKTAPWNRYPVNESPELLQKLAAWHGVKSQQILLGNGSNQLFQTLLTATLEPGDKVLYTTPTFSLYHLYTDIYDGKPVEIPQPPGEDYPLERFQKAIASLNPKLTIICSPNNPTGFELQRETVEQICRATQGLVFFDEAYGEFSDWSAVSLLAKHDNILISRTFSKAFSMAGLRFGYFIGNEKVIRELRKVNLPYNVNIFTEMAALRLLQERRAMQQQVDYLKVERRRLYAELKKIRGIEVFASAANFLLVKGPDELDLFR